MRLSLIALGLLAVACGSAATRSSSQLDVPAAPAILQSLVPLATVATTTTAVVTASPTARPATSAPAATPSPARTAAPAAVAGFDATRYIGQGDRYNCADFASQAQAQAVLRASPADPNRLDTDRDGIACESNNAPYDRAPVAR